MSNSASRSPNLSLRLVGNGFSFKNAGKVLVAFWVTSLLQILLMTPIIF
jgi:hypothetical protein